MKRYVSTIKQYDYSSNEEFEKHKKEMIEKGYYLVDRGMFGGIFDPHELQDEKWKFSATYLKSPYY